MLPNRGMRGRCVDSDFVRREKTKSNKRHTRIADLTGSIISIPVQYTEEELVYVRKLDIPAAYIRSKV
jgi:hypothetical protein